MFINITSAKFIHFIKCTLKQILNKTAEVKKKQLELQYEFENHQLDAKINALCIQKKYDTLQSYIYL